MLILPYNICCVNSTVLYPPYQLDAKGLGLAYILGKFDGILGLAFPALSVNKVKTPFNNVISQGLSKNSVFAFYLGTSDGDKGELVIGGTDPAHYTGRNVYHTFIFF